ncbi:hypothetical protein OH77DRAFT_184201 [Trametes cingulata]|nr:hypothetical protein OH77DRAFT_184201 [Trametes cingulata]
MVRPALGRAPSHPLTNAGSRLAYPSGASCTRARAPIFRRSGSKCRPCGRWTPSLRLMLLGRVYLFSLLFAAAVYAVPLPAKGEREVVPYGHPPEVAQTVDTVEVPAYDDIDGQVDISEVSPPISDIALPPLPLVSLRQARVAAAHARRDDEEGSDDTEKRNLLAAVCALASLLAFVLMSVAVFAWDLYKKSKDRVTYVPQPPPRPAEVPPKAQEEVIGAQRAHDLDEVQLAT